MKKDMILGVFMCWLIAVVYCYSESTVENVLINNVLFDVIQISSEGMQNFLFSYSGIGDIEVRFNFVARPVRRFGLFDRGSKICIGSVAECDFNCVPSFTKEQKFSGCLGSKYEQIPLGEVGLVEFWFTEIVLNSADVVYEGFVYSLFDSRVQLEMKAFLELKKIDNWGRSLITILRNNTCYSVSRRVRGSDAKVIDASVRCCKNLGTIIYSLPYIEYKEVDRRLCSDGVMEYADYEDFSFSLEIGVNSVTKGYRKNSKIEKSLYFEEICDGRCSCYIRSITPGLITWENRSYFVNRSTGWYSGNCSKRDELWSNGMEEHSLSSFQVLGVSSVILACSTGVFIISMLGIAGFVVVRRLLRRSKAFQVENEDLK